MPFIVNDLNMYTNETELDCRLTLRYRSFTTPCNVSIKDSLTTINLGDPIFGVVSDQLAVFYMGGKVIDSS